MTTASTLRRRSDITARLERAIDRLEELYHQRRVWCVWCGDVPGCEEADGCCSDACLEQFRRASPSSVPSSV